MIILNFKESVKKICARKYFKLPHLLYKKVHCTQLRTHQANEDIYKAGLEVNFFICQDENGHNIA